MSNRVEIDLIIDGKKAKAVLGDVNKLVGGLRSGTESISDKLSKVGNIATGFRNSIGMISGFGRQVGEVIQKYTEFESGLNNVNTLLRLESEELNVVKDGLIKIGLETGEGLKKLTDATYQAVSAGYSMEEALELVEIASRSAVAGITDTEIAVDGITSVLNAFHLGAENSTKVADIMFKTVERGKTTFPEIASSISLVAPLASSMGIGFEEISGAIATLTKQGTPTAQAITQIRASLVASNKELGDGWTKTMSYQEGMAKIAEKAGGSQNKLQKLVGSVEAVGAVLGVTGANALEASKDLDAMTTSVGAMGDAFDIQSDSIEQKTKRLQVATDNLMVSLVENIAPSISYAMERTAFAINVISGAIDKQRENLEKLTRKEYVVGWYLVFNGYDKSSLKAEAEIIQKELDELTSTPTVGGTLFGLLGIETDGYEEDVKKIKELQDQLEAINHILNNTTPTGSDDGKGTPTPPPTPPTPPKGTVDDKEIEILTKKYENDLIEFENYYNRKSELLDKELEKTKTKYGEDSLEYQNLFSEKLALDEERLSLQEERDELIKEKKEEDRDAREENFQEELTQLEFELDNKLLTEESYFDKKRALLDKMLKDTIETYGKDSKEANALLREKQKNDLEEVKSEKAKSDQLKFLRMSVASNAISGFSDIANAFANQSHGAFLIAKRASELETLFHTYTSAQKAYESQFVPPLPDSPVRGAISAGIAIAQGLARVAVIEAQSFAIGGVIDSPTLAIVGDAKQAGNEDNSEFILNTPQMQTLLKETTNSPTLVNINYDLIRDAFIDALNDSTIEVSGSYDLESEKVFLSAQRGEKVYNKRIVS